MTASFETDNTAAGQSAVLGVTVYEEIQSLVAPVITQCGSVIHCCVRHPPLGG